MTNEHLLYAMFTLNNTFIFAAFKYQHVDDLLLVEIVILIILKMNKCLKMFTFQPFFVFVSLHANDKAV